jgi:protein subunit release factor A
MKLIAIGIIALGVIIGGVLFVPSVSDVVTKTIEIEKTVEVTPEWAQDEDAVKAAQDVIRRKELEAELAILQSEVTEREARITEIEKDLGTF